LIFLHKIIGFKIVAILLSVGMVVVVFQFSSAFKVHALNVHTEIKANPPGIARIIDRTGNPPPGIVNPTGTQPPLPTSGSDPDTSGTGLPGAPPPGDNGNNGPGGTSGQGNSQSQTTSIPPGSNILGGGGAPAGAAQSSASINGPILTIIDHIDFGTVFPEETIEKYFTVTFNATTQETFVTYNITMSENMTPHVTIYKATEIDTETDNSTEGDNYAEGTLQKPDDTSDKWIVKLSVPDILGDYKLDILIQVP